ncbi:MAG: hypothetical protein M3Y50_08615, partial [Acidobacteriota bacterium]|nr:hypothetical protein [Acidobacteriota bacterium]
MPISSKEAGSGVGVKLRVPENGVSTGTELSNCATLIPLKVALKTPSYAVLLLSVVFRTYPVKSIAAVAPDVVSLRTKGEGGGLGRLPWKISVKNNCRFDPPV